MTKITMTLAGALILGGLGLTSASAAPAMPQGPALAGDAVASEAAYRSRRGYGMRRQMRRPRSMRSDPNSRNPSQPGYQQQKGQTSGGPRY